MKTAEYWSKRMEALNEAQLTKGDQYAADMAAEYDKALARIKRDTEAWYARLAKNNEVSLAEARKLLTANELKEFRWTVQDYIKAGRENAIDQRWMKELENASAKVHISKLESIQTKLQQEVELLAAKHQKGTADTLGGIYKDNYYKSVFELQKGSGVGTSFAKLDDRQIDKVLSKPWTPDGRNFSSRIWSDRTKLISELQTTLTQNLINGSASDKVIADFADRMGVSKASAKRLIVTEAAYFAGQSRADAYREMNVERYKYVATLDSRTSTICRGMDGRVFLLSEAEPGVNYPPLHGHCRSTTIPYYDDSDTGERAARGADGKTYYVPSDMTYKDWAEKHAPPDAEKPPKISLPQAVDPAGVKVVEPPPQAVPLPIPPLIGRLEEPQGFNRRFNPKASYHVDLPAIPEGVAERLSDVNRAIARQGSREGKEILVALGAKGKELARVTGEANKVRFTQELHDSLLAAAARSVILTHNHPRGTRVNVKDAINLAVYPSLQSIVAVGHDGGVSFISANTASGDLVALNSILRRIFETIEEQLRNNKKYVTMSKTAQEEFFDYLVLQQLAKEMGWVYGEDFSAAKADPRL